MTAVRGSVLDAVFEVDLRGESGGKARAQLCVEASRRHVEQAGVRFNRPLVRYKLLQVVPTCSNHQRRMTHWQPSEGCQRESQTPSKLKPVRPGLGIIIIITGMMIIIIRVMAKISVYPAFVLTRRVPAILVDGLRLISVSSVRVLYPEDDSRGDRMLASGGPLGGGLRIQTCRDEHTSSEEL
eukprot:500060-Rhodomonas_salina.1